ncbi:24864_t:CDS:1 [Racocetra persica]|uniref:24864_t:CDS:1 n=1 Tax=Racocetra persica TaxID=160502 RepID=A0ACA9NHC6_9GLOM|nr:24864_t:CDS:1 [Racocetra persica]
MRQPGYRRINQGLRWNADPIEKAKYEICQNILHYKQENNLSEKEIGERLGIKKPEKLEYLLFCHIDKFTLDKLVAYATELLAPFELKVVRPGEEVHVISPPKLNGRSRKQA